MAEPIALSIAGSDSCGGAGVQADLKTMMALGVYGATAITAVTAQDSHGVYRVDPIPPDGVRAQIEAVLADLPVAAIKLGMLGTAATARVVADALDEVPWIPVVLDPVMVATTGHRLLDDDAVEVVRSRLLPRAVLATPNLPEAAVLAGAQAVELWARAAPTRVLVTGGDATGAEVLDTLYGPDGVHTWRSPRQPGSFHGTGCTLSSAIASHIALGLDLRSAIEAGLAFTARVLNAATTTRLARPRLELGPGATLLPHHKVC